MNKGAYHYAWNIVISCFLLQMIMLFGLQSIPMMLPDISKTLDMSATAAGGLTSAFSLFYGGLGFVWGFVADKIGARKVLIISLACVVIGLLAFGIFGTTYLSCCILYAIVGIGCAAFTVATIPRLMGRWFTNSKRHRPAAICMMGGVFCGALQGVVLPKLIGAYGWNTTLIILAVVALVFAIFIIAIVRDTPAQKGLLPKASSEEEAEAAAAADAAAELKKKNEVKGLRTFIPVLKMGFTWKLIIHTIFYQMGYVAINSFLVMAIMSAGYTRVEAGLVVTVYNIFQIIAMFTWGSLADKIEPRLCLSFSLVVWTIGVVVMIFCFQNLTLAYIAIAITGLGLGAPGLMMSIMADYFPPEAVSTGSGISSTIGTVGRTLGPIIAGALVDSTGTFVAVFVFAAIVQVIALVIPFSFGNVRKKKEAAAEKDAA